MGKVVYLIDHPKFNSRIYKLAQNYMKRFYTHGPGPLLDAWATKNIPKQLADQIQKEINQIAFND